MYHHEPREIIRLALTHAISDRQAMLDGMDEANHYFEDCKKQMEDFEQMYRRRYGQTVNDYLNDKTKFRAVSIEELRNRV